MAYGKQNKSVREKIISHTTALEAKINPLEKKLSVTPQP